MVVDPERGHEDRLWASSEASGNQPSCQYWRRRRGEVGGDGCVGDPGKGEQVIARIGRAIPAERPGTMDDEYLIPVEADFLISNIVQLAIDDEGADDEANRNKN